MENYKIEVNQVKIWKKRGIKAAEFLAKEAVDVLISGEDVGEGPSYVLMEELIQIVDLEGEDLDEILDNALSMVR